MHFELRVNLQFVFRTQPVLMYMRWKTNANPNECIDDQCYLTDHTSMSVCITKDLHKTGFIVAYVHFCISMASVVSV